ncbi:hypothetical protein [Burkholderia stabilis]|uniref:hypothetical protein n=1 Tax=Burkholderia stabilis TaxID=95485 RepID=UPI001012483C|nr:hypothetical protein [Burkholderia stabilis]
MVETANNFARAGENYSSEMESENFSSFQIGLNLVPDVWHKTPSGVHFRANDRAGRNYPPVAQVTYERGLHAIAIQLGALDRDAKSNSIDFDFPMGLSRQITQAWVTVNARLAGAFLTFAATCFDPDSPLPELPITNLMYYLSNKGDVIYAVGPFGERRSLVSINIDVNASAPSPSPELPLEIKRIAWRYGSVDVGSR